MSALAVPAPPFRLVVVPERGAAREGRLRRPSASLDFLGVERDVDVVAASVGVLLSLLCLMPLVDFLGDRHLVSLLFR